MSSKFFFNSMAAIFVMAVFVQSAEMQNGKPLKINKSFGGLSFDQGGERIKASTIYPVLESYASCKPLFLKSKNLKAGATAMNILAFLAGCGTGAGLAFGTGNLPVSLLGCAGAFCVFGIPGLVIGVQSNNKLEEAVMNYNKEVGAKELSFFNNKLSLSLCIEF